MKDDVPKSTDGKSNMDEQHQQQQSDQGEDGRQQTATTEQTGDASASDIPPAATASVPSATVMEVIDVPPNHLQSSTDMMSKSNVSAGNTEGTLTESLSPADVASSLSTGGSLASDRGQEEINSKRSASTSATQPGAVSVAGISSSTSLVLTADATESTTSNTNRDTSQPLSSSHAESTSSSAVARRPTFTLPVAEEYQAPTEMPLISAELVVPPPKAEEAPTISAMFHVDIDPEVSTVQEQQQREQHIQALEIQHAKPEMDEAQKKKKRIQKRGIACVGLLLIVIITATVTTVVVQRKESARNESAASAEEDASTEATLTPTFPYECFNSTLDLFTSQYLYPDEKTLIMCPGTRIKVGTFKNPSRQDYNISGGDFPIQLFRRNVTIQCGLDGKRSNSCVLEGGLIHVIAQYLHGHPEYGYIVPDDDLDNFTIKGFTFTGKVQASGVFGGIPAAISHPGKNIRFEDCAWVNLTATKRILAVGTNYMMTLMGLSMPDLVAEVIIEDCLFDDVFYEEEFLVSFNQALHVRSTVFRNIHLPELLPAGCGVHPNGCRNLLHCHATSPTNCSIHDICVENAAVSGAAPIVIGQDTEWSSSGNNRWIGPLEYDPPYTPPCRQCRENASSFCELSAAVLDDFDRPDDWANYTCLDPPVFTLDSGSCRM